MNYSSTFAASSPTVSRSSSQPSPSVRIPRYLRRYTICATQHRPTSPLANSFIPDDYYYFRKAQEHDPATAHHITTSRPSHWDRRRSESFTLNPGPKVRQCRYTTPSPYAPAILSRAHSLSADVSPSPRQSLLTHDLRPPPSDIFIHSQLSVSSFSTECSFHTAVDHAEYNKTLQPLSSNLDSSIEQPRPHSWDELPLSTKPDWSESSNSGSRSSAFGFGSRGGQSSADTVVSPADESSGIIPEKEENNDEWPVTYLTTVTRQELDDYEKENKTQKRPRKFTWGRKEGRKFTDKGSEGTSASESDIVAEGGRRKSRKLKKKRPESLQLEEQGIHALDQTFDTCIIPIYTQGDQEEFDPLRDLTRDRQVADASPVDPDETMDEAQIGIAISSDDILQGDPGYAFDVPLEAILSGQDDEWEDMESADRHGCRYIQERMPSEDGDRDMWLDDAVLERIRSRTPQEILQGLDVVHEEEEEDSVSEVKVNDAVKRAAEDLAKRGSYEHINNKGKERQDDVDADAGTHWEQDRLLDIDQQAEDVDVVEFGKSLASCEDLTQPAPEKNILSSEPRRRKLSKRRRSRHKITTESPPPLPDRDPKTKSKGDRRDTRRRSVPTSKKKPSTPTLRPRRTTPKTVLSTVKFHVFRPFALLLGIDVANGRKRLSRELRTPNALLVGRHFSEKHIPRFPSRLDGLRTVDKKIAKFE